MNHHRLDSVLSWAGLLEVEPTAAAEFEALRRLGKLGRDQRRRMTHLEGHLDKGDVVCNCYEQVLPLE